MYDAGLRPLHAVQGDWTAASGYEAGRVLADRREVTAVFAANDQMAIGVLRALSEAGRTVPADVSVVGFDDIPEAAYLIPPLTTVRQDFAAVGQLAISVLRQAIEGADGDQDTARPPDRPRAGACAPAPLPRPREDPLNARADQYVVGVDYGTLSGRALVVRVADGAELGTATHAYPHAVLEETLPGSGVRAAAGLGAAGARGLPRGAADRGPRGRRRRRHRPGRRHRHRHRLHRLHDGPDARRRHPAVRARRARRPAARAT